MGASLPGRIQLLRVKWPKPSVYASVSHLPTQKSEVSLLYYKEGNSLLMNVLHHMTHGIQPSREDIKLLSELLHAEEGMLPVEPTGQEEWLSTVIQKPWGYKYRVYVDAFYDLWHLCLRPGESTSLHCHPRKVTALICLHGEGTVRLLSHQQHVKALSCLHLGKGVFHATENSGLTDLDLIEVEVPRNKLDLLRAKDRYGRAGLGYEQPPRQD